MAEIPKMIPLKQIRQARLEEMPMFVEQRPRLQKRTAVEMYTESHWNITDSKKMKIEQDEVEDAKLTAAEKQDMEATAEALAAKY